MKDAQLCMPPQANSVKNIARKMADMLGLNGGRLVEGRRSCRDLWQSRVTRLAAKHDNIGPFDSPLAFLRCRRRHVYAPIAESEEAVCGSTMLQ
jgi:hypothetical protein